MGKGNSRDKAIFCYAQLEYEEDPAWGRERPSLGSRRGQLGQTDGRTWATGIPKLVATCPLPGRGRFSMCSADARQPSPAADGWTGFCPRECACLEFPGDPYGSPTSPPWAQPSAKGPPRDSRGGQRRPLCSFLPLTLLVDLAPVPDPEHKSATPRLSSILPMVSSLSGFLSQLLSRTISIHSIYEAAKEDRPRVLQDTGG